MSETEQPRPAADIVVYDDADALVRGAAGRLLTRLVELQRERGTAELCLTGGRIANRIYARVAELVTGSDLDTAGVDLWWGDERFVPTGDPDRNAGKTLGILGGAWRLDPSRAHPMPASASTVTLENAAANYAAELGDTVFDICLLGVGPDGHIASMFPNHPSSQPTAASVIAVTDAPKPPGERISVTMNVINRSREVWFLVSGADKADAVAGALGGDLTLPAARAAGRQATWWLLDRDAADDLPAPEAPEASEAPDG